MFRAFVVLPLAAVLVAACVASAQFVPPPQQAAWQPAPLPLMSWMKPGTRLTYYTSQRVSEQWTVNLVPDEAGLWMDANDPRHHFSEADVLQLNGPAADANASAGYGVRQSDVVAVDPDGTIAVDAKSFSARPDLGNALLLMPGGQGLVGTVEAGASLWIHPQRLAAMLAEAEAKPRDPRTMRQLFRTTVPSPDNRQQLQAVRIVDYVGAGHVQQTYDLATGLLLIETSVIHSGDPLGPFGGAIAGGGIVGPDGRPYQSARGHRFTFNRLLSMRDLKLPLNAGQTPLPALFARPGQNFSLQGGCQMIVGGYNPPTGVPATPVSWAVQVLKAGRGYALAGIRETSPNAIPSPSPDSRVVGPASIGGWCISPAIFADARPGATIDEDPITRNKIVHGMATADGLRYIEEVGPLHRYIYGYEPQTGLLRVMQFTLAPMKMTYSIQLFDR